MKVRVTSQFQVSGKTDLDVHTDVLHAALLRLENEVPWASEADLTAALSSRLVNISVVINGTSWTDAERKAGEFISQAIENVGGHVFIQDDLLANEHVLTSGISDGLFARMQTTELVPA